MVGVFSIRWFVLMRAVLFLSNSLGVVPRTGPNIRGRFAPFSTVEPGVKPVLIFSSKKKTSTLFKPRRLDAHNISNRRK